MLIIIITTVIIVSLFRLFVSFDLHLLFRLGLPRPDETVRVRGIHFHVAASPRERRDSVPDVSPPGSASTGRSSDGHPQPFEQGALEQVEHQQLPFVRVQHDLSARDVFGWKQREEGGQVGVFDQGAEMRQGVGADSDVPHAHAFVVTGRDEMPAVFRPDDTVAGADVCLALVPGTGVFALSIFTADPDGVVHVQDAQASCAPPDVPQLDGALGATASQYVLVARTPCHGEHGAAVAGERVRAGARSEIDQSDGRVLRRARHEEMIGNGRQGVGVDDGVEVEGCGEGLRLRRVYLQGVVVGGGEEGEGVEGVEGEMGDAESVSRGRSAGFRGGFVNAAVERVPGALEIP